MDTDTTLTWDVVRNTQVTPTVFTLSLKHRGERPSFIPGQYLTVHLPGHEPIEGKSYSISSIPSDPNVALAIRRVGAFSRVLTALQPGATVTTTKPYGFFYPDSDVGDVTLFAGGIGIVPCMSILRSLLVSGHPHSVLLHYSNRTRDEVVFYDELRMLAETYPHFSPVFYITRESAHDTGYSYERISGSNRAKTIHQSDATYFVCGSIGFTRDIWKFLRAQGIPESSIYTEGFF